MSDFYKKFLVEEVPKATPGTNKQVFLAAFGKHPGWDDHVEDLGLDTESLISAKTLLYVKGIGGEIDAGAWEKLDSTQVLPGFRHIFVWQRGAQSIVGRLWASSDGKGRTRYPMVVCAHCSGLPLPWVLEQVLPRLERLEQACTMTTSAAEVKAALSRIRAELREMATRSPDTATTANGALLRERFLSSAQFGENQEGLLRIVYQMQSQFSHFAQGKFNPRADASTIRPQHVRVPWGAETPDQTILLWSQLMQAQVDPAVPVLFQVPLQESWIDITVGEPTREEMFCLRASLKSVPLASEIPYNLDESFRQQARALLEAFLVGRKPAPIRPAEPATSTSSAAADRPKPKGLLSRWFGAVILVAVLAGAGVWMMSPKRPDTAAVAPAREVPAPTPPATTTAVEPVRPASVVAKSPAPTAPVTPPPQPAATIVAESVPAKTPAPPVPPVPASTPAVTGVTATTQTQAELDQAKADAEQARQLEQARAKLAAEVKARMEAAAKLEQTRIAEARKAEEEKARREREAVKVAAEQAAQALALATKPVAPPSVASVPTATVVPATAAASRLDGAGFTNSIGMAFRRLSSGIFAGQFEVTEGQFKKITGRATLPKTHGDQHPVQNVSWTEAEEFCRKLTETEKASGWLAGQWVYTLPTEKQWVEFVGDARLEDSVTSLGLAMARLQPEPVAGSRGSNQFGLFDVRGNVWEWCLRANNQKVLRGGAYNVKGANVASVEYSYGPVASNAVIAAAGFRCVMVQRP